MHSQVSGYVMEESCTLTLNIVGKLYLCVGKLWVSTSKVVHKDGLQFNQMSPSGESPQ